MHGIVKVRTSAEKEAIRLKEQARKCKEYLSKSERIFTKREKKEYDDEILLLTSQVLLVTPDDVTFWNIRKETLTEYKKIPILNEELDEALNQELRLTKSCLSLNPKAYGIWHHRCWILDNFALQPDWKSELALCNAYLQLDGRNFHCWDYRRFVVSRYGESLEHELEYTSSLIASNISNYSAWHYRTKLLSHLYPSCDGKISSKDAYNEEMSMVENAVFTDPDDQSAWYYHHWLINHLKCPQKIVQASYDPQLKLAWVSFNRPIVNLKDVKGFGKYDWQMETPHVLIKEIKDPLGEDDRIISFESQWVKIDESNVVANTLEFTGSLDEEDRRAIVTLLDSFEKLYKMEPNNKRVILAIASLKEKLQEGVDYDELLRLKTLDPLRKNFYDDLVSRLKLEILLSNQVGIDAFSLDRESTLTRITHLHCFTLFRKIKLDNNPLGNKCIKQLNALINCQILSLKNCGITSISDFPVMRKLQQLDIRENEITDEKCPENLKSLKIIKIGKFEIEVEKELEKLHENFSQFTTNRNLNL